MNKELIVFDFDYTLAKTRECIWIWSPRGTRSFGEKRYTPVHPTTLNKRNLGDDEEINDDSFKEFYSVNIQSANAITLSIKLFYYYINNEDKYDVYIITARPEDAKLDILSFLKKHKIKNENIKFIGLKHSDPKVKIDTIKKIINDNGYGRMSIYEDNLFIINNIDKAINCDINKYYVETETKKERITLYEQ
jgi:hypothetical protein